MSYDILLEAAGAEILNYKEFGDDQGSWWAKINFEGKEQWIHGWYGSCESCDDIIGELGDSSHMVDGVYHNGSGDADSDCLECQAIQKKMAEMGTGYIEGNNFTQEEAEKEAQNLLFEDDTMLDWVKENCLE